MNLYLIVFLLLAAGTLLEWFRPQHGKRIYWISWTLMTALLCFRYGQGTDYVTYEGIYATIPAVVDWSQGYICGFYPEIGWRILSAAFKIFHAPFWVFTMVLGFAEMLLLHRFLSKYANQKAAGLYLTYPVLYLVYMVSGLRQGLAICIFLGIAVPFYLEKKWIPYVVSILLAASFHKVGFAWLVLIVVAYVPVPWMLAMVAAATMGGLLLQIGSVQQLLVGLLPFYHVKQFLLEGSISYFAIGERVLSFAVIMVLYVYRTKKPENTESEKESLLKIYICGLCFYMLMMGNAYYASRYSAIFKVVEGALLVWLFMEKTRVTQMGALFFFCLTMLMGVKNLNAIIREGWYDTSKVNLLTYPYISVFDREKINEYLDYSENLENVYRYNIEDQQLWMIEN
jgi:hypothetical protein